MADPDTLMASLQLPDHHRDAFIGLTHRDQNAILALASDLEGAEASVGGLRRVLARHLPDEPLLVEALVSFGSWRASTGYTIAEALTILTQSLGEGVGKTDLAPVLRALPLLQVSKSADLEYAYDKVLHSSRIITDVRPIFADEPETHAIGSLITHNLMITYSKDGLTKDLYLTLDRRDLEQLQGHIQRAKKKHVKLEEYIERANLALTRWQEDDR